jgi:uncharacterized protein (TIRG00374 family)
MARWRQLIRVLAGFAATGAFLALFARKVDMGEALGEFRSLPWWATVAGAAMVLVNLVFMSIRWRYLVQGAGYDVALRPLARAAAVGQAGSNILPFRGGDVLRVESVREAGVPAFVVIGTLFAEKVLDGLALAAWIVMGALMLGKTGAIFLIGLALMAGAALGVVVLHLAARDPQRAQRLATRAGIWLPVAWRPRVERAVAQFLGGLGAFADQRRLTLAFLASIAMWAADVVMYAVVGWAYDLDVPVGTYFLLEGVANLALAIPAAAAGIGTFDYLTLVAAQNVAVPAAQAPAYVLTVHALTVVPITIVGAFALWRAFPRLRQLASEPAGAAELEVEPLEHSPGSLARGGDRARQ